MVEPGHGQHAFHSPTRDDRGCGGLWGQTPRAVAIWLPSPGKQAQRDARMDLTDNTCFGDPTPPCLIHHQIDWCHCCCRASHRRFSLTHTVTNASRTQLAARLLSALNSEKEFGREWQQIWLHTCDNGTLVPTWIFWKYVFDARDENMRLTWLIVRFLPVGQKEQHLFYKTNKPKKAKKKKNNHFMKVHVKTVMCCWITIKVAMCSKSWVVYFSIFH